MVLTRTAGIAVLLKPEGDELRAVVQWGAMTLNKIGYAHFSCVVTGPIDSGKLIVKSSVG
jgi:hypothetical protein